MHGNKEVHKLANSVSYTRGVYLPNIKYYLRLAIPKLSKLGALTKTPLKKLIFWKLRSHFLMLQPI